MNKKLILSYNNSNSNSMRKEKKKVIKSLNRFFSGFFIITLGLKIRQFQNRKIQLPNILLYKFKKISIVSPSSFLSYVVHHIHVCGVHISLEKKKNFLFNEGVFEYLCV